MAAPPPAPRAEAGFDRLGGEGLAGIVHSGGCSRGGGTDG